MKIKLSELWDSLGSYPEVLQYHVMDEYNRHGSITIMEEIDKFVDKYGYKDVSILSIWKHSGGFAVGVSLIGGKNND